MEPAEDQQPDNQSRRIEGDANTDQNNDVKAASATAIATATDTAGTSSEQPSPLHPFPKVVPIAWREQDVTSKQSIFTFPTQTTVVEPVATAKPNDNPSSAVDPNQSTGNRQRTHKSALASKNRRRRRRKSKFEAIGAEAEHELAEEAETHGEEDGQPEKHVMFAPLAQPTPRLSTVALPPVPPVFWRVVALVGRLVPSINGPIVQQLTAMLRNRLHLKQAPIQAPVAPMQLEPVPVTPSTPPVAPPNLSTTSPTSQPTPGQPPSDAAPIVDATVPDPVDAKPTAETAGAEPTGTKATTESAGAEPAGTTPTTESAGAEPAGIEQPDSGRLTIKPESPEQRAAEAKPDTTTPSAGADAPPTATEPVARVATVESAIAPTTSVTAAVTAAPSVQASIPAQVTPLPSSPTSDQTTTVPTAQAVATPTAHCEPLQALGPTSSRMESSRPDSSETSTLSTARYNAIRVEKRLRSPSEIPELGLLEFLGLGSFSMALSLAYDVLLFRRNISPVCYELLSPPKVSALRCSIFARAALAFNTSTRQVTFGRTDFGKPAVKTEVDSGVIELFHALRINTIVVRLCIDNVAAKDNTMYALAAMIRVNSTLTSLSMQQNQLTAIGIQVLCEALASSPDSMLIDLNLSHNCIADNGAEHLGSMLQVNETLTCLDISYNSLSSRAVMHLLGALRENFVLRRLAVYGKDLHPDHHTDNIDIADGKPIGRALQELPCLAEIMLTSAEANLPLEKAKESRWVQLTECTLKQVDTLVLSELLPLNSKLLTLDLSNNIDIRRGGILQILRAISTCTTLKKAVLVNTGLYEESAADIADLVAANETLEELVFHEQVIPVQQMRGQRPKYQTESIEFIVAKDHFLDRWVLTKCLELNRFTTTLNDLSIEENLQPNPTTTTTTTAAASTTYPSDTSRTTTIVGNPSAMGKPKSRKPKAHTVNFSGRQLEVFEVVFLSVKTYHHRSIQGVTMHGCGLEGYGATHLADAVRNHATLTSIELENNAIGPIGGKALAECVEYNQSLTSLNLSWNKLGDEGVARFETALVANRSLKVLDLRGNQITFVGINAISKGLSRNWALRVLNLRWNSVCAKAAVELAHALSRNKRLRVLDVEHHNMRESGAMAFAEMLEVNEQLQEINMKGDDLIVLGQADGIGAVAAERLTNALMHKNKSLTNLNLAQTQLTREGLMNFSDVLRTNATIKVLDLSRSDMDGSTAAKFFQCLGQNRSLEKLNLANNRISNEGMVACIRALELHQLLRDLNLTGNRITDEPLGILARKFHEKAITSSLTWLCLADNVMSNATRLLLLRLAPRVIVELDREVPEQFDERI